MTIDKTLARLLSNFFLDIAKAIVIATFITPSFSGASIYEWLALLTRGLVSATFFLLVSWWLAKEEEK